MFKRKCRCGKTEKSFKNDIGPFFMNTCCEAEGYDCRGKKPEDYEKEKLEAESQPKEVEDPSKEQEDIKKKLADQMNKVFGKRNQQQAQEKSEEALLEMTAKELMEYCDSKDIKYSKRDTKKKLVQRILK